MKMFASNKRFSLKTYGAGGGYNFPKGRMYSPHRVD
jgi:hypothetical protein